MMGKVREKKAETQPEKNSRKRMAHVISSLYEKMMGI